MYEELVKRLRYISNSDSNIKSNHIGLTMMQAADAIDELDTLLDGVSADNDALCETIERLKKPRWIPVTERLPEEEEVVLVWGGASVYTAKRHNEYGRLMWWKLNSKRHYCNPTHWMPLPKPPKEETE